MGTKAHYERNRVRIREQQRAYYARTKHLPDRKRAIAESVGRRRAAAYGLTLSEYVEMRKQPCEICCKKKNRMVIDHDHETNKVRGVLCFDCNTSIGKLGDNIEGLQRALRYLEKASEKHQ